MLSVSMVSAALSERFSPECLPQNMITGETMKPVAEQLWIQFESVIATFIYAAVVTYIFFEDCGSFDRLACIS